MDKNFYLASELAEYLRLNPDTIRRLARSRKIPALKVGGQWRFDMDTIAKWQKGDFDI